MLEHDAEVCLRCICRLLDGDAWTHIAFFLKSLSIPDGIFIPHASPLSPSLSSVPLFIPTSHPCHQFWIFGGRKSDTSGAKILNTAGLIEYWNFNRCDVRMSYWVWMHGRL